MRFVFFFWLCSLSLLVVSIGYLLRMKGIGYLSIQGMYGGRLIVPLRDDESTILNGLGEVFMFVRDRKDSSELREPADGKSFMVGAMFCFSYVMKCCVDREVGADYLILIGEIREIAMELCSMVGWWDSFDRERERYISRWERVLVLCDRVRDSIVEGDGLSSIDVLLGIL